MNKKISLLKKGFMYFMRVLPLLGMLGALIWFLRDGRNISLDDILNYSPESPVAAVLFIWLAFGLKSLSMMFPVLLIFAVTGRLFPLPEAIAVNTVGIAITLSLPYFVGRASGGDLTERLLVKYPRLADYRAERNENSFFFSLMLRAMGVLPCDVVSLYSGNTRVPYLNYISGGVLGFMPDLLGATIVGQRITEPGSPWFWLTIIINLSMCAAAIAIYSARHRRLMARAKENSNERKEEKTEEGREIPPGPRS